MSIPNRTFFYIIPLPLIIMSLFIGPSDVITSQDILAWMQNKIIQAPSLNQDKLEMVEAIVFNVRLPRVILAFLIGSALTVSGNSFQALFRNPLVSPDILGLSAGAAFGAALALVFHILPLQLTAFVFGLLAVGLSYFLALTRKGVSTVSLILAGIIVSGIFTALLTVVQFLTDPFKLQTIVHWTMGNLHNASWSKVKSSVLPILLGIIWLFIIRWRMNVIALGDEETRAVGLNPEQEKIMILLPATLIASASVAVAGVIGMVGLAFPHMVRMMTGPDNRKTQPVSIAFGGSFLLLVDDFCRTITSFEIPIGIFTTLIGGPFFVYLLKKSRMVFRES
ncbi:MAG: iron ABC transporter permease [Nitrospira sp.]|nr:iron ABC transporter permease [Nitrospira sp.]